MWNELQFYLIGQILTRQAGGQPYCDTAPYCECSLAEWSTKVILIGVTLGSVPGKKNKIVSTEQRIGAE